MSQASSTSVIDAMATACLLGACAAAVYADRAVLAPRWLRRGQPGLYTVALFVTMSVAAGAGVLAIQVVYNLAWGRDPARYSLAFNFATDFLAVALHVAVVGAVARRFRRRSAP